MTPAQQEDLFHNTARSVGGASKVVQERHIKHCTLADQAYGQRVARALAQGISPETPNAVV